MVPLPPCLNRNASSALRKSSAEVSLRLASEPSTRPTSRPNHSATALSSVKSVRPASAAFRCAARIASNLNPCGVCARQSPSRFNVSVTWPSLARLMVSVTGSEGRAASCVARQKITRSIRAASTNGRAASWISTLVGRAALRASRPARTEVLPHRAAQYGRAQACCVGRSSRLIKLGVIAVDHHENLLDASVFREGADRTRQHRDTAKRPILFRHCSFASRPRASTSRHDERCDCHKHVPFQWLTRTYAKILHCGNCGVEPARNPPYRAQ